jgi:O-antigen ligase
MSKLLPAFFGTDVETPKSTPIPPVVRALLIATLASFYLASAFESPVTGFMLSFKWVPLGALGIAAAYALYGRPAPHFPVAMSVPMIALLAVAIMTSTSSTDVSRAVLTTFTVTMTIVTGYVVSALIVASDSRRAFFELLATIGRVVIVITCLFALAGLNLGRGSGLSAWSDNPNTLAAIFAPLLVVFLIGCIERRPGWAFWHGSFFVVGFYLVWATNSRASTIWIILALAGLWLYRRGPGVAVLLFMLAMIIIIGWRFPLKTYVIETLGLNWSLRDNGISPLSGREEVWRIGWDLFQKRPINGYGLGTSPELLKIEAWRFVRHQGLHFHSSYIMLMVETGIFGLIAAMTAIVFTLIRGIADSTRTRILPRENWPLAALPFALIVGALGHALFESWLIAAGNPNMMLFWTWVWMVHHQAQVKIRKVITREVPSVPLAAGAALPIR